MIANHRFVHNRFPDFYLLLAATHDAAADDARHSAQAMDEEGGHAIIEGAE